MSELDPDQKDLRIIELMDEVKRLQNLCLNVGGAPLPPAKPIQYETWLVLYDDGKSTVTTRSEKDRIFDMGRVECRHIVWNSDGSPVGQGE